MNRGIYVLKMVKHLAALVVICAIGATTVQAAEVKIDIKPAGCMGIKTGIDYRCLDI